MQHQIIRERDFYKGMVKIMLPVALQQGINMGVNMMDTMMLGKLGEAALSASSLANQYYSFFQIFCMGIIGGTSVLASQYYGAKDLKNVRETFNMAIRLAAGAGLLFALLTWFFPRQIMTIYTNESAVIAEGVRYLTITVFIFFLHGTSLVASSLMRNVGKPKLGLYVSIVSFFVNIGANYIFIFGKLGMPRMEIAGAALGTLIARAVEFLITFGYIFFYDHNLELRPVHLKKNPSLDFFKRYFKTGAPVLVSDSLLALGGNMVSIVLGHMGSSVVAANAVCMVVDRLCTVITAGVGNAATIMTGVVIGQGNKERAQQQAETFFVLSILFGAVSAVLVLIIGPMTIRIYALAPETIVIAKQMMWAYAFVVFFQCMQAVSTKGYLRGGGDTKFLMMADILFMWLVSIPLGAVGGLVLGWPAWFVTMCLRVDYAIKSIWCYFRMESGKWIHDIRK